MTIMSTSELASAAVQETNDWDIDDERDLPDFGREDYEGDDLDETYE